MKRGKKVRRSDVGEERGEGRNKKGKVVCEEDEGKNIGNGVEWKEEIGERRNKSNEKENGSIMVEREVIGRKELINERKNEERKEKGFKEEMFKKLDEIYEKDLVEGLEDLKDFEVINNG